MTWQPTAVLYPDAELVTINLLRALVNAQPGQSDVKVLRDLPPNRPPRCIQVVRDGGPQAELRDIARMRLVFWDTTEQKVGDLARLTLALLPRMAGQSGVLKVGNITGPSPVPDAAPKRLANAEIHLRGEALP